MKSDGSGCVNESARLTATASTQGASSQSFPAGEGWVPQAGVRCGRDLLRATSRAGRAPNTGFAGRGVEGRHAFCKTPAVNAFHADSFSLGAKISGIETFPCSIRSPMLESLRYSCLPGSEGGTLRPLGKPGK